MGAEFAVDVRPGHIQCCSMQAKCTDQMCRFIRMVDIFEYVC